MEDGEEKQSASAYPSEMLYVVESIVLNKCDSSAGAESSKPGLIPGISS